MDGPNFERMNSSINLGETAQLLGDLCVIRYFTESRPLCKKNIVSVYNNHALQEETFLCGKKSVIEAAYDRAAQCSLFQPTRVLSFPILLLLLHALQ